MAQAAPSSRDSLFEDDTPVEKAAPADKTAPAEQALPAAKEAAPEKPGAWRGFAQAELARTIADPVHWSKMRLRLDLSRQGRISENIKWKIGARADYDAVFDLYSFYPPEVQKDQRAEFNLRENYLDIGAGNWDFRLGRQQVVWGEMVGLFFADVVSAKDLREFILPEFEVLRIPQWAARAEYFKDDFHAELLWVPVASYDEIGKPGAEFFPTPLPPPPGFATQFRNEVRPSRNRSNTNYGLRLSTLRGGWDVSGFYYRSMDASPTFYREVVTVPQPAFVYEARHDRIDQFGGTLAKHFGSVVLKGETVYTRGRSYSVTRLSDIDGVVPQNTLDWVLGLEFALPHEARLNLQGFQRAFFKHDSDTLFDKHESGYSVLLAGKLTNRLEAQALWISSLNRNDWLFRPRLAWNFEKNWRLLFGVDVFKGPPQGLFGRFDNRDRVYSELRYSF